MPERSKTNPLALDIAQQMRIGIPLWMRPLHLPDRQWLYANARFQQHLIRKVCHRQLGRDEFARAAMQQNGDIGIAIRAVRLSRAAAKEDRPAKSY